MNFVTWGGVKVTNWENSLLSSNGNGLMRGWTKQEKRKSVINSVYWNPKIVNQTNPKINFVGIESIIWYICRVFEDYDNAYLKIYTSSVP